MHVTRFETSESDAHPPTDFMLSTLPRRHPIRHPMNKRYPSKLELRRICRQFRIGQLVSIRKNLGGMYNLNLCIETTSGEYVVRVMSGYATAAHLKYEMLVQDLLGRASIPVVAPMRRSTGQHFCRLGSRMVQVTRYVQGHGYTGAAQQIFASGRMLRKFHDALKDCPAGPKPRWSNYPSYKVMKQGLSRMRAFGLVSQHRIVRQLYDPIMKNWNRARRNLPTTVIHGDWHLWNQIYTAQGDVKCVFDFEFIHVAERLYDVGYALWMLLLNRSTRPLAVHFLRGYGSLTQSEYRALPPYIAMASLNNVCTAPFMLHPLKAFQYSYRNQVTFLKWVLSKETLREILYS